MIFDALPDVSQYSIKRDKWSLLPAHPVPLVTSSICILDNSWLYSFEPHGKNNKLKIWKLKLGLKKEDFRWEVVNLSRGKIKIVIDKIIEVRTLKSEFVIFGSKI